MLKYKSFKVDQDEAINDFIKENEQGIAPDSMTFIEGRVCFLYSTASEAEMIRENLISGIKQFIGQRSGELLGKEIDVRYYQSLSLRSTPKAEGMLMDVKSHRDNLVAQIRHARVLLTEVESGSWTPDTANHEKLGKK